ncbi:MAG: hypothetical protein E7443_02760 [Ruminococcaceae bacterium]|nr:hypothetical protein [Oscillospiraceae bacterium]
MNFTYQAYADMLALLKDGGYRFCDYHTCAQQPRCVILRHDIDTSLEQALRLAEVEAAQGVRSTWFVLLRTDFYNVFSLSARRSLQKLLALGHEVGLHFDEVAYGRPLSEEETVRNIQTECGILSTVLERPVTCVSMHRPSQATLEADLQIPGIVNSYGKTFFRDFKYLSDSRRRWREPVLDIIRTGEYDRLHILTHAFWYHEQEEDIAETVGNFVRAANGERYVQMKDNITDLASILREDEV